MMKKVMAILTTLCLLATTTTPVQALQQSQTRRVRYNKPVYNMMEETGGAFDMIGTIRMSFPDVVFEENMKLISQVMYGQREKYVDTNESFEHVSFHYNVGLHLLPFQMQAYTMAAHAMGVTDPITYNLAKQLPNQSPGVVELYRKTLANYRRLGYLNVVD